MEDIDNTNFGLLITNIIVILWLSIHIIIPNDYLNMVTKREVTEANTETADNHTPTELLELMRLCPVFALLGSTYTISFCCK